jgi:hypothetical protein
MKIKVKEAEGIVLDWFVAKSFEESKYLHITRGALRYKPGQFSDEEEYSPSTNWEQGGQIIQREGISCITKKFLKDPARAFLAYREGDSLDAGQFGSTMLIAAMRYYVTSKLGDEVEVPEDLI